MMKTFNEMRHEKAQKLQKDGRFRYQPIWLNGDSLSRYRHLIKTKLDEKKSNL